MSIRTHISRSLIILVMLAVATITSVSINAGAQEYKAVPLNVHDTKMAPYRALAQLIFESFERKDYATAATLAKVLNVFWDSTAGNPSDDGAKTPMDKEVFGKIDSAMDLFAQPIADYGRDLTHGRPATPPDPSKVEASYKKYIEALKLGD